MYSKQEQVGRYRRADNIKSVYTQSEHLLQVHCERYLRLLGLTFIRIPDVIYRSVFSKSSKLSTHLKGLISSIIKGVPDLTILNSDGRFLCVELKVGKNKQSEGQKSWAKNILNHYKIARSFDEFEKIVKEFLE